MNRDLNLVSIAVSLYISISLTAYSNKSQYAFTIQILTNIQMLVQNAATLGASAAEMLAKMPKEAARMSIVVIIVLPIACAYPFFQQYFISGLTVGAVKG